MIRKQNLNKFNKSLPLPYKLTKQTYKINSLNFITQFKLNTNYLNHISLSLNPHNPLHLLLSTQKTPNQLQNISINRHTSLNILNYLEVTFSVQIKISYLNIQLLLHKLQRMKIVCNPYFQYIFNSPDQQYGLLSMDNNNRLLFQPSTTLYPIIGIWTKNNHNIVSISTYHRILTYLTTSFKSKYSFIHNQLHSIYYVHLSNNPEVYLVKWTLGQPYLCSYPLSNYFHHILNISPNKSQLRKQNQPEKQESMPFAQNSQKWEFKFSPSQLKYIPSQINYSPSQLNISPPQLNYSPIKPKNSSLKLNNDPKSNISQKLTESPQKIYQSTEVQTQYRNEMQFTLNQATYNSPIRYPIRSTTQSPVFCVEQFGSVQQQRDYFKNRVKTCQCQIELLKSEIIKLKKSLKLAQLYKVNSPSLYFTNSSKPKTYRLQSSAKIVSKLAQKDLTNNSSTKAKYSSLEYIANKQLHDKKHQEEIDEPWNLLEIVDQ